MTAAAPQTTTETLCMYKVELKNSYEKRQSEEKKKTEKDNTIATANKNTKALKIHLVIY